MNGNAVSEPHMPNYCDPQGAYLPSCGFWRRAIRHYAASGDVATLQETALALANELEKLREWVHRGGELPPMWQATQAEGLAKGWGYDGATWQFTDQNPDHTRFCGDAS